MTLIRRLQHLRKLLRIIPRVLEDLDALETLVPKLEALTPVLKSLSEMDRKIAEVRTLEETVAKIESLDESLARIQSLGKKTIEHPAVVVAPQKTGRQTEEVHGWNRLQLLAKFVNLIGKATVIEQEWQKIQQAEHDAFFAFQVFRGNGDADFAYRKGIREGIQWCIDRFC